MINIDFFHFDNGKFLLREELVEEHGRQGIVNLLWKDMTEFECVSFEGLLYWAERSPEAYEALKRQVDARTDLPAEDELRARRVLGNKKPRKGVAVTAYRDSVVLQLANILTASFGIKRTRNRLSESECAAKYISEASGISVDVVSNILNNKKLRG